MPEISYQEMIEYAGLDEPTPPENHPQEGWKHFTEVSNEREQGFYKKGDKVSFNYRVHTCEEDQELLAENAVIQLEGMTGLVQKKYTKRSHGHED